MIERLSGTFHAMKRVGSIDEFVNIIKECTLWPKDVTCRLHIYPYGRESQLIVVMYVDDGRVSLLGFDPVSSAFVKIGRGAIKDVARECYVEVYRLTRDAISIDMDIIDHAAKVFGYGNLLEEIPFNELIEAILVDERQQPQRGIADVASNKEVVKPGSSEGRCEIVVRELIKSLGESGFSESLSRKLSEPSTIAKILLYSEEYVITTKECRELTSYVENLLKEKDHVAIKLQAGDYSVWLVKSGSESGVHDFVKGRPASYGSGVIDNWEKVKSYLNSKSRNKKRVEVYVYSMEKDLLEN